MKKFSLPKIDFEIVDEPQNKKEKSLFWKNVHSTAGKLIFVMFAMSFLGIGSSLSRDEFGNALPIDFFIIRLLGLTAFGYMLALIYNGIKYLKRKHIDEPRTENK